MAMECQIGGIRTKETMANSISTISKWVVRLPTAMNVVGHVKAAIHVVTNMQPFTASLSMQDSTMVNWVYRFPFGLIQTLRRGHSPLHPRQPLTMVARQHHVTTFHSMEQRFQHSTIHRLPTTVTFSWHGLVWELVCGIGTLTSMVTISLTKI